MGQNFLTLKDPNEVDDNDAEGDLTGDDDPDVNVSMDIDASADDAEAMMGTMIIDFDAGDMLGKLLAFINQVCMLSTHWGSLSDCLKLAPQIQKVR